MLKNEPEKIEVRTLPSIPLMDIGELPSCPALYFVLDSNNAVLYIGYASSLQNRWRAHHRLIDFVQIPNARIAWMVISEPQMLPSLERVCIDYFQPPLNRTFWAHTPYRLQIFVPDEEAREAMKDVAHREKKSLQQLTLELWYAKLHEYPEYQHFQLPERR